MERQYTPWGQDLVDPDVYGLVPAPTWQPEPDLLPVHSSSQEEAREVLACVAGEDDGGWFDTPWLDALRTQAPQVSELEPEPGPMADDLETLEQARTIAFDFGQWGMDALNSPGRRPKAMDPMLPWATDAVNPQLRPLQTISVPQGAEAPYWSDAATDGANAFALVNGMIQAGVGAARWHEGDSDGAWDLGQGVADATGAGADFVKPNSALGAGMQVLSGGFDAARGVSKVWNANTTGEEADGYTDIMKGTTAASGGVAMLAGAPAAVPMLCLAAGMEMGQQVTNFGTAKAVENDWFGDHRTPAEYAGDNYRRSSAFLNDALDTEYVGEAVMFLPSLALGMGATIGSFFAGVGDSIWDAL